MVELVQIVRLPRLLLRVRLLVLSVEGARC
jgi:hypothetical protein